MVLVRKTVLPLGRTIAPPAVMFGLESKVIFDLTVADGSHMSVEKIV